ncbi:MAG: hypothetical protein ACE3L7_01545 [Candidatus Pristimantibacillus sp.]
MNKSGQVTDKEIITTMRKNDPLWQALICIGESQSTILWTQDWLKEVDSLPVEVQSDISEIIINLTDLKDKIRNIRNESYKT